MNHLRLQRTCIINDGCFSVLMDLQGPEPVPFALSVERTFEHNGGNWVKIPDGLYLCKRTLYVKHGYETFEILIPNHTRILFHKGNVEDHSLGCVVLGENFGTYQGKVSVMSSGVAFSEFMERFGSLNEFYCAVT